MTPEQRWREGREHWRLRTDRELFDPREFGVELLDSDREARAFVERHHSRSYVAARLRVGLYRKIGCLRSFLAGVCVFSVPMQPAAIPKHTGVAEGVELGRLVLLDERERSPGRGWRGCCRRSAGSSTPGTTPTSGGWTGRSSRVSPTPGGPLLPYRSTHDPRLLSSTRSRAGRSLEAHRAA